MSQSALNEALAKLKSFIPKSSPIRGIYTLERIQQVLHLLGDPQNSYRGVHIAGTSGKTSTAYYIRGLLDAAGQSTGLTVSPHIDSITERVQVNGRPLADDEFGIELNKLMQFVDQTGIVLTYFEVLIAFAYQYFAKSKVDYAVIETGLGGLMDGTNTIHRSDKLCVLTDIGLDHTEILGTTIRQITYQKAGIIQPGNHVLMLTQSIEAVSIVREVAKEQHASLELIPHSSLQDDDGLTFQERNWALAKAAYNCLANRDGLSPIGELSHVNRASLQPPGRLERMDIKGHYLVLDGAHNPQKLKALRRSLAVEGIHRAAVLANFLVAPEDKLEALMNELLMLAAHLIIPEFVVVQDVDKRSCPAFQTAERARRLGCLSVEVVKDPARAFVTLLERPEKALVVTGSLYLISTIRPIALSHALSTGLAYRASTE